VAIQTAGGEFVRDGVVIPAAVPYLLEKGAPDIPPDPQYPPVPYLVEKVPPDIPPDPQYPPVPYLVEKVPPDIPPDPQYPPSPNLQVPQYPDPPCRIMPLRDKPVVHVDSVEPVDSVFSVEKLVPAEDVPWDIDKGTPAACVPGVGSQEEKEEMCQMWQCNSDINIFVIFVQFIFDTFD
jgi:hypothetical protein